MPIFEFSCSNCQKAFELLILKQTRPSEVRCPNCQSRDVRRLISHFGVRAGRSTKGTASGKSCASCAASSCARCL